MTYSSLAIFALIGAGLWYAAYNAPVYGTLNIDALSANYDPTAVNNLGAVYDAMIDNGSLTDLEMILMLSQCLIETGAFTGAPNSFYLQNNNWANIRPSGNATVPEGVYTGVNGNFAVYNNLNDFITDYIRVLSFGAMPINANGVNDFWTRLLTNNFFGTTDPNNLVAKSYLSNLTKYYNLLTSTQQTA